VFELKTQAAYPILLTGAIGWCALIILAPLTASMGDAGFSHFLYSFFGSVCHQMDARSLHIAGYKLAVCARCSAMYFGFLFGLVINPAFPKLRKLPFRLSLFAASAPMLLDVCLGITGIHQPTIATRLATGAWFGFIFSHLILVLFDEALSEFLHSKVRPIQPIHVSQAQ
jgi:uncharacterized membrane protein